MKMLACVFAALLSFAGQAPPKEGKVASETDPKADFTKFATYTWDKGYETFDTTAHKAIVAAVDAELSARGLKRLDSGAGDVTIRYHTNVRTDVVLDKIDAEMERQNKPAPTKTLGRLVIVMRDPANRRVWAADTVQPIDSERAKVYQEIPGIVAKLFATYPRPRK